MYRPVRPISNTLMTRPARYKIQEFGKWLNRIGTYVIELVNEDLGGFLCDG
jgi:hypothetical protein